MEASEESAVPKINVRAWRSSEQGITASHFVKVSQLATQALSSLDYPSITHSLEVDKDAAQAFSRLGQRMVADGLLMAPAAEALGYLVAKGFARCQQKDYELVSAFRGHGVDNESDHEVPFPGGAASWSAPAWAKAFSAATDSWVSAEAKSAFAKGISAGSGVELGFGLVAAPPSVAPALKA